MANHKINNKNKLNLVIKKNVIITCQQNIIESTIKHNIHI